MLVGLLCIAMCARYTDVCSVVLAAQCIEVARVEGVGWGLCNVHCYVYTGTALVLVLAAHVKYKIHSVKKWPE